jgi:hypothetical protein
MIQLSITQVSEKAVTNMRKLFKLTIREGNNPVNLEKDEVLEDILICLEYISD